MATRLREAGHEVGVLARTREASARARSAGLEAAATIAETCRDAQVVLVCVFTDAQVRDTCFGADGIVAAVAAGGYVVIHTTGSPTTAEEVAVRSSVPTVRRSFTPGRWGTGSGSSW